MPEGSKNLSGQRGNLSYGAGHDAPGKISWKQGIEGEGQNSQVTERE
jgi:hypothetical protein